MTAPILLRPGFSHEDLSALQQNPVRETVDIYEAQLKELAEIRFPHQPEAQESYINDQSHGELAGVWVYYPWSGVLLHCVPEEALFELRTNRNKNLITADEQQRLSEGVVAVAGMSVGSGIALACIYSGISNTIKLADFDTLETANLNRLRETLPNIGKPKAQLAAQHIYEVHPFANVQLYEHGVTEETLSAFFEEPRTALVVDEIDDFKMKIRLRQRAKAIGVPLLMFTSLGDNILIDVERYDLDKELALFNGALGDIPDEILEKDELSADDLKRYAVRLVGQEYVPTRAMASLLEIGTSLVGRPQLYSTIAVDGGLAAYVIKTILLGQPLHSGRYFVKFADLVQVENSELEDTPERQAVLRELLK